MTPRYTCERRSIRLDPLGIEPDPVANERFGSFVSWVRAVSQTKGGAMSRRVLAAIGIVLLAGTLGTPGAGASGGGGCPPPITNGTVTKSLIEDWCFEPTAIHIRPGETITWVNRDPVAHTVTGANRAWGSYNKLKSGKAVSYRFDQRGTYPYYCVYHLGMVGTVVVRDGVVPGSLGRKESAEAVQRVKLANTAAASAQVPALPGLPDEDGIALLLIVGGVPVAVGLRLLLRRARAER
jgi:plastocyanin